MHRALLIIAITIGLAGCAEQQAQQAWQARQAMLAAAVQQHNTDYAACRARFSESNNEAVARAKCFIDADTKYAPTTAYPDLSYLVIAKRIELAERQAAGKITHAQAQLELQQVATQTNSEEQRRRNEANAVAAQQQANNNAAAMVLLQSMQANRPQTYNVNVCNVPGQVNTCIYR